MFHKKSPNFIFFFRNLFSFSSILILFASGFRKLSFQFFSHSVSDTWKSYFNCFTKYKKQSPEKLLLFFFIFKLHFFPPKFFHLVSAIQKKEKIPWEKQLFCYFICFTQKKKSSELFFHFIFSVLVMNLFPLKVWSHLVSDEIFILSTQRK